MFLRFGVFMQLCIRIGHQQMPSLRGRVYLQRLFKRLRRCRSLIHLDLNITKPKQCAFLRMGRTHCFLKKLLRYGQIVVVQFQHALKVRDIRIRRRYAGRLVEMLARIRVALLLHGLHGLIDFFDKSEWNNRRPRRGRHTFRFRMQVDEDVLILRRHGLSDFGAIFGGSIALCADFYVAIPRRHILELHLCASALCRPAHIYACERARQLHHCTRVHGKAGRLTHADVKISGRRPPSCAVRK